MRGPSIFACLPGLTTHCLLQNFEKSQDALAAAEQPLLPPPPPSEEILPSEAVKSKSFVTEPVPLQGGLTLLKGRVNSQSVLKVANTDLVPGKYEGGLKLWECTIDLVETLRREIQDGQLSFRGKRVLELGCGHGLPGILACIKGASSVHFQDFNAEVLRSLTINNVNANLDQARGRLARVNSDGTTSSKGISITPDLHYYAGDWADVHNVLSVVRCGSPGSGSALDGGAFNFMFSESDLLAIDQDTRSNEAKSGELTRRDSRNFLARKLSGSRACERGHTNSAQEGGYDIVLMSETVYSLASLPKLYELIKKMVPSAGSGKEIQHTDVVLRSVTSSLNATAVGSHVVDETAQTRVDAEDCLLIQQCLRPPYGVVYVAGKKHYFGVGGGTRQFKHLIEDDGIMGAHLVADFADGSSNVREIWKFFFK